MVESEVHFDGIDVRAMKWLDNRGVTIASTFESTMPVLNVKIFYRKIKRNIEVDCEILTITETLAITLASRFTITGDY